VAGASFDSFPGSSAAEFRPPPRAALAAGRVKGANMAAEYDLLEEDWRSPLGGGGRWLGVGNKGSAGQDTGRYVCTDRSF